MKEWGGGGHKVPALAAAGEGGGSGEGGRGLGRGWAPRGPGTGASDTQCIPVASRGAADRLVSLRGCSNSEGGGCPRERGAADPAPRSRTPAGREPERSPPHSPARAAGSPQPRTPRAAPDREDEPRGAGWGRGLGGRGRAAGTFARRPPLRRDTPAGRDPGSWAEAAGPGRGQRAASRDPPEGPESAGSLSLDDSALAGG